MSYSILSYFNEIPNDELHMIYEVYSADGGDVQRVWWWFSDEGPHWLQLGREAESEVAACARDDCVRRPCFVKTPEATLVTQTQPLPPGGLICSQGPQYPTSSLGVFVVPPPHYHSWGTAPSTSILGGEMHLNQHRGEEGGDPLVFHIHFRNVLSCSSITTEAPN